VNQPPVFRTFASITSLLALSASAVGIDNLFFLQLFQTIDKREKTDKAKQRILRNDYKDDKGGGGNFLSAKGWNFGLLVNRKMESLKERY
jgi:hypothetical protein